MDALIFDFDGVVVDSEPVHLATFQAVLKSIGVPLTKEEYYARYIGFNDHDCFQAALDAAGKNAPEPLLAELIAQKTAMVQRAFAESIKPLPGACELIRAARDAGIPVGVCSGALREEIELASRTVGVLDSWKVIVASQDVRQGKPSPEGYSLAMGQICQAARQTINSRLCIAVEDAPAGIQAARDANMRVLAVTNSFPASDLKDADLVVNSLKDVHLATLEQLL